MSNQAANPARTSRPTSSTARASSAAHGHGPSHTQTQTQTQTNNPSITSASATKARHLSHLHSQLAQLSANLSDLENLVRMTAVQAESMRGLGGWSGGLFMAASKVLGEETIAKSAAATDNDANNQEQGVEQERG